MQISEGQQRVATWLVSGLLTTSLGGAALVGYFAGTGLGWAWLLLMAAIVVLALGTFSLNLQRVIEGGDGAKARPPKSPEVPSAWPPEGEE